MTSWVVTGGGRGVGRSIAEMLAAGGDPVVVVEFDPAALSWSDGDDRIIPVTGDAADPAVAGRAAALAEQASPLGGWVNNAAVFRDAWLHEAGGPAVLDLVGRNLGPVLAGCAAAIRTFRAAGRGGAIVNVSSHQAQRPVRGSLPYATAKAATEGLTRALAVDYGPHFVNGAVVPIDGGRSAVGRDPEERSS